MYSIIWKYKIKSENKEIFESEYGSNGAWYKLFCKSENYHGSCLYKSNEELNTYILIDIWANQESYDDFINSNNQTYQNLSCQFEILYETEEKLGTFNSI